MKLAIDNKRPLADLAEKAGNIVEREQQDMWDLGEILCSAREICNDPLASLAEGITGKTGNHRFSMWLSNDNNLLLLSGSQKKRAMDLHRVFGHRRNEVKNWRVSTLYDLAADSHADVREEIVDKYPNGLKRDEFRDTVKRMRTPANDPAKETTTSPDPTPAKQTEASPHLVETQWADLLDTVNITTDTMKEAVVDMLHPQHMVAKRLDERKVRLISEVGSLAKPERKKAMVAVVKVLEQQQEVFTAEMKALAPKYNRELESRLKSEIAEQKKITAEIRKKLKTPFDKKDFRVIRGVLHSDREVSQSQKDKAFNLFLKLAPLFE